MNQSEKLKLVIEKAGGETLYEKMILHILDHKWVKVKETYDVGMADGCQSVIEFMELEKLIPCMLFNHDFAKAFWSEGWLQYKDGAWQKCTKSEIVMSRTPFVFRNWEYHLQQAVLEEDPLTYYFKHLNK